MYTCINVYIYVCTRICIYQYIYTFTYVYIVCVCVCVCIIPQHFPDLHIISQTCQTDKGSPCKWSCIPQLGFRGGENRFPFKSNVLRNINASCTQENILLLHGSKSSFNGHCFIQKTEPRVPCSV